MKRSTRTAIGSSLRAPPTRHTLARLTRNTGQKCYDSLGRLEEYYIFNVVIPLEVE